MSDLMRAGFSTDSVPSTPRAYAVMTPIEKAIGRWRVT
jgi:hypothetical protein